MTTEILRVLLLEDSDADAELVSRELRRGGRTVDIERVQTEAAMRASLERPGWDIVVSDWSMPSFSAERGLEVLRELQQDIPFIIVSGTIGEDTAVAALRSGARDFLVKNRLARLQAAVDREIREGRERRARREAEAALRRSEEQLRQSQKMDAIGRLAGGVAHDFNNLLSVILTYSEMAVRNLPSGDPLRDDLEEIRKAGERAAGLTRQLLAFSRKQVLEQRIVDLNELVGSVGKLLGRLIGEDIALSITAAEDLGTVRADPGQLEQVLMNLAVNARDAMPHGGNLWVETSNATLTEEYARTHLGVCPGVYVAMAVRDDGTGMDEQVQPHIFEPFFTTKGPGRGTGLGLSTVFGIVQQSGGHIAVRSAPGQGSTFTVYLPRVDGEVGDGLVKEEDLQRLSGSETVLLVEDEPQVRGMVLRLLRQFGYHVLEAEGGAAALALCDGHPGPIHVLLVDVVMPQMNGPDLAKQVAARHPDLKVLFMSGYLGDAVQIPSLLDTAAAFIQKPFTPEKLAHKLREVISAPAAGESGSGGAQKHEAPTD